jgi:S1-C subfamily serine protease
MEELTKTQLILLALLVSFITSIATGIVTVTLLDQAPPGVTQTINRVVERTVERVVPGQAASVITKETTVVIKEENLIIDAVEKNSKQTVRIALADEKGEFGTILGLGVIVSNEGLVVTDSLNLIESKEYLIEMFNSRVFSASLDNLDSANGLSFLKPNTPAEEGKTLPRFGSPNLGNSGDIKLGQTVIAIGGLSENTVSTGIVSKLNKEKITVPTEIAEGEEAKSTEVEILKAIISNISFSSDYSGGPLMDVDGFILGINLKRKDGNISVPVNTVLDIISKKLENDKKMEEIVEE